MKFKDSFDEYMNLYSEGKEKGLDGKACWDGYKLQGTKKKGGKTVDNCVKSDEEVEDCETCGCEEKPEYGHLDDTYSNYIVQYKEPAEDAEYDMGEVLDAIADDIKSGMTRAELEAEHGADNVWKFMQYLAVDRRGRPTTKTNPRPHVNRKVVDNIKNTKGSDPIEDAEGKHDDGDDVPEKCDYVPCEDGEAGCECGNCPDCMPAEDGERVDKDRMKCNKPRRTSGGSKKFVVKACENGKEKVVRFGDPKMKIKKSNPKARKSFRARHKCDQKKSKFSAGYWSCKKW